MRVFYTLIVYLFFSNTLLSQNLEWINTVIADNAVPPYSSPEDITIDTDNNSYLLGDFDNSIFGATQNTYSTIVKYTETGEIAWYRNFERPVNILNITAEEGTCDLYSLIEIGPPGGTVKIGDSTYNFAPNLKTVALLKTDSAYNIKWLRVLADSMSISTYIEGFDIINDDNNVYALFGIVNSTSKNEFKFKGQLYNPTYKFGTAYQAIVVLKLSKLKNGDNTEWMTTIVASNFLNLYNSIEIDALGSLYILYRASSPYGEINNNKFSAPGSSILKLANNDGSLNNYFNFDSAYFLTNFTVIPSGKLFVALQIGTSFNYRGKIFTSIDNSNALCMFLDTAANLIWASQEENQVGGGNARVSFTEYQGDNLYCTGLLSGGNSGYNGFPLKLKQPLPNFSPFFVKFDTLGNCLWAFCDTNTVNNGNVARGKKMGVDYNGKPIVTGEYSNSFSVLDTTVFGSAAVNAFIMKISDYSITRGYVYSGPYCAGDTIKIPYTKIGKFEAGNEFIAQLSDEKGEFTGKERELGRLKDTIDGTIKGVLPLFNVNTSGNYRIRILSTKPRVQSYYRQDTLRLLIYSRDSANAGNDTFICRGQSIQLSTTGGSRWEWSPASSLDDSTLFKPTATPTADTRYRIIISDSSGCGDTDTDYVWVRLRKPLDIQAPFTDSTICRGQIVKLYATGTGGDSTQYNIAWYEKRTGGEVLLNANADSITTTSTQNPKNFYAVLTDNCTTLPDTQNFSIKTLSPLSITIKSNKNNPSHFTDTLLCYQAGITLYANGTGGRSNTRVINWYKNSNTIATGDSLLLMPAQPDTYYAIVSDNCTARPDTGVFIITQRPPLSIAIQSSDSVCSQNPVQLAAKISGGDSTQYQTLWTANNVTWTSNQNPTQHFPTKNTTYIATASDNCSPSVADTISVTIFPLPTPQFTINNPSGCPPLQVQFTDKSKGNDPTQNHWQIGAAEINNIANPIQPFTQSGFITVKLKTTNAYGCTDSITKTEQIHVFKKPQASFVVTPAILEAEEKVSYHSTSTETVKYQWDLGDGNLKYSNGDTSTTYADTGYKTITLVAENTLGCKDTAYKTIHIYDKIHCTIPSGFTPNGDGLNNTFSPVCVGITNYTLTIYNRWGQVIYQKENGAWDGTYADAPAPEGVYMYKIHLRAESHKKSMVYGTINLIR